MDGLGQADPEREDADEVVPMVPGATERVQSALGLDDAELCDALGLSPVQLLAGEGDTLPHTAVLDALLRDATEAVRGDALRRWVHQSGADGRSPLGLLAAREYGAFEDALSELRERGFVVRARR